MARKANSRGKLHPEVKRAHLYDLFKCCDNIVNIIIRTSRGGPHDRCYASVEVRGTGQVKEVLSKYSKKPPMILGLPVILSLGAVDMPDLDDILESTLGYAQEKTRKPSGKATRYINIIRLFARLFADDRYRCTGKPTPSKRIIRQETELDIEDQARPLVGSSRRVEKPVHHNVPRN